MVNPRSRRSLLAKANGEFQAANATLCLPGGLCLPDLRVPGKSLQASLNDRFSLKAVARYGNADEWDARFCKRSPHYLTSTEYCAVRLAGNFLRHLEDHF